MPSVADIIPTTTTTTSTHPQQEPPSLLHQTSNNNNNNNSSSNNNTNNNNNNQTNRNSDNNNQHGRLNIDRFGVFCDELSTTTTSGLGTTITVPVSSSSMSSGSSINLNVLSSSSGLNNGAHELMLVSSASSIGQQLPQQQQQPPSSVCVPTSVVAQPAGQLAVRRANRSMRNVPNLQMLLKRRQVKPGKSSRKRSLRRDPVETDVLGLLNEMIEMIESRETVRNKTNELATVGGGGGTCMIKTLLSDMSSLQRRGDEEPPGWLVVESSMTKSFRLVDDIASDKRITTINSLDDKNGSYRFFFLLLFCFHIYFKY